jgi:hypothetical protein
VFGGKNAKWCHSIAILFSRTLLFPSACFGLACSHFTKSLRCSIRSFIWELSVLLIYAFMHINFPLGLPLLCPIGSGRLYFYYHLISFLIFSMTCSNVLFSLQVFEYLVLFLLLLSCSFIVLWSDSTQGVISIFLYLLRLALWQKIWSIMEKVPAYYVFAGWNTLQIAVRSIWCIMSFISRVSLLIFLSG